MQIVAACCTGVHIVVPCAAASYYGRVLMPAVVDEQQRQIDCAVLLSKSASDQLFVAAGHFQNSSLTIDSRADRCAYTHPYISSHIPVLAAHIPIATVHPYSSSPTRIAAPPPLVAAPSSSLVAPAPLTLSVQRLWTSFKSQVRPRVQQPMY